MPELTKVPYQAFQQDWQDRQAGRQADGHQEPPTATAAPGEEQGAAPGSDGNATTTKATGEPPSTSSSSGPPGSQHPAIGKEVAATHSRVDALLKATVSAIKTKMSARKQLLMTKLAERAKKTTVAAQLKTTNQGVASDIATVNKALAKIKSDNAASAKIETTMASCTNQKKVFDSKAGKCVDAVASADSNMAKVHHHGFENDDGRDCGYLNYRTLEFEKFEEDTYVRVFYYDNMRVHGHQSHARWNVMFCSPGGQNCAKCKDPGQIMNWRYSHHQHNWCMNDHTPGTAFGLCRASESQKLGKGKWSIRIMLDDCRYDIYAGSGNYGSVMVDEVMRY